MDVTYKVLVMSLIHVKKGMLCLVVRVDGLYNNVSIDKNIGVIPDQKQAQTHNYKGYYQKQIL